MQNYYTGQKKRLLKNHDKLIDLGMDTLNTRYDGAGEQIAAETRREFEQLIPQIPYIGGKQNRLTDTIEQMTSLLALYRVLKARGVPVEEIGALVQQMATAHIESFPGLARRMIGRLYMSQFWRKNTRKRALELQKRQYEGNFVYEVVEGNGDDFEWGVNYLECGVVKFFHQQAADEFTPYMCLIDNLMFPAMGVELVRQGTIANGCTHCDFRFK
jgi:hypothetical protein